MSDPKEICSKEEMRTELDRYNALRDTNLENKLLKQKAEIVRDIQDAIGKSKSDLVPLSNKMDTRFDDIEDNYKDLKKEVEAMQIKQTIMNEQLKPIKNLLWTVLTSMVITIVSAIIGLVIYK